MSCLTCTRTKPVSSCIDNLIIGTVDVNNTAVYVYLENINTGYIQRVEVTTSAAGLVTLPLEFVDYSGNFIYNVWVTLKDATNQNDYKTITIGADTQDCLEVQFKVSYYNELVTENETDQILALE